MTDERRTNKEIVNVVKAVIGSWSYNRNDKDMYDIIKVLIDKVSGYRMRKSARANDEDIDLIYGTFVMFCGDYGTSPRTGWFGDMERQAILVALYCELDELITLADNRGEVLTDEI